MRQAAIGRLTIGLQLAPFVKAPDRLHCGGSRSAFLWLLQIGSFDAAPVGSRLASTYAHMFLDARDRLLLWVFPIGSFVVAPSREAPGLLIVDALDMLLCRGSRLASLLMIQTGFFVGLLTKSLLVPFVEVLDRLLCGCSRSALLWRLQIGSFDAAPGPLSLQIGFLVKDPDRFFCESSHTVLRCGVSRSAPLWRLQIGSFVEAPDRLLCGGSQLASLRSQCQHPLL